ncbi:MAG TPA: AAA family ATPase [Solirubrobacteraceae bacterium]|nr:AAA family ATPase [Solirubrobacteraceae bacterium]
MEQNVITGAALVGRDAEIELIAGMIDGVRGGGGALLIRGDPGVGKSALLAIGAERASERGLRVLKATGVQSEAELPFAGLHQLLQPLVRSIDELAEPQRVALGTAFGMLEAPPPDLFRTSLAALELLADAAAKSSLLVIAEDAQWLDRSSADVLAFVARRLEFEPILLLAAVREGYDSPLEQAGLRVVNLGPLDPASAWHLLDGTAPVIAPAVRELVLVEAAGNPLALRELPGAFSQLGTQPRPAAWLPLTTRLERAFAARLDDLPAATRTILLVAALNDGPSLGEVLAASGAVIGEPATVDQLTPAVSARIIEIGDSEIEFRHPLMRSAIRQQASVSERHVAQRALAEQFTTQPERRAWHRAASVIGPDEGVAAELETMAARAQERGATAAAVAALERAGHLSDEPIAQGRRLLRAAELGFEVGDPDRVNRLITEAEGLELGLLERSQLGWLRGVLDGQQAGGAHRFDWMVDTATTLIENGEDDMALKILWSTSMQCWWSDPGTEVKTQIVKAADRARAKEEDPRRLVILAYAAPVDRGSTVATQLSRATSGIIHDPDLGRVVGTAANAFGAFNEAAAPLAASVAALRRQGRLGLLARTLNQEAWSAAQRVDLGLAVPVADEAVRLTLETQQPTMHFIAVAIQAIVAALRGDRDTAEVRANDAAQFGASRNARALLALVQHARGIAALGEGANGEAYEHLRRVHTPSDPAYHSFLRAFNVADLVDAAAGSGQLEDVLPVVSELDQLALRTPSPVLVAGLSYARAVLASDDRAEELFETAASDTAAWPFLQARAQLACGEWLHRRRRDADSRAPLRAARDAFDALRTSAWSERARVQLRAAGETSHRRERVGSDELTAQELQIAQLAASGLSNREIGQMLYLSHRTISSHLYRIFPKLGITSRSELASALELRWPRSD